MIVIDIAIVIIALCALPAAYRILVGPNRVDRVSAADMLMFILIPEIALLGYRFHAEYAFDLVLVAAVVGFLSAASLSRALMRGAR